jgi:hypothetical protein
MSAHIVAFETFIFLSSAAKARLTAIATPTMHLTVRAVRLGHLERQRVFLDS